MPTYDYACDQCGHRFEARQSFADEPLTVCPECQGHIRRVIHPSGIIFKGSGWYVTDSRESRSAGASSSDGGDSQPASSESASTDSKESSSSNSSDAKAVADE